MSGVTIIMDPDNNKVKIDMFYLKKIFIGTIRGDQLFYISLLNLVISPVLCSYRVFLSILQPLLLRAFFLFYTVFILSSPLSTCRLGS